MTDVQLFLTLAQPDEEGKSRIISKSEFVGEYSLLDFNNGCNWMRSLKGKYLYETSGRAESWTIKLLGFDDSKETRGIRKDIRDIISKQNCVHTGFRDTTQNPIEVDHKNGRYDDTNVLDFESQNVSDFQPLCRQANLQKRSDCKKCRETGIKFDARELGYNLPTADGIIQYNGTCEGCYWFNPKIFKENLWW
jgi:hypothetical protein